MTPSVPALATVAAALLLCACGGGGASSGPPSAPPTSGNSAPVARFTSQPDTGPPPLAVAVDARASFDDGTITRFEWDFGDGASANGATASHVYRRSGTFTIRLTVTDDAGAEGSATDTITVNVPPVAAFAVDVRVGAAPLTVTFDGTGSADPDGSVTDYRWSFGDGSSAVGATVSHTYEADDRFRARLTVVDDAGAEHASELEIRTVFELAGSILAQAGSTIDSDVNATFVTPIANDTLATAQRIQNPATVGGYVAAAGNGADGAVSDAGDEIDVFRFPALGGETVVLTIGDPGQDLDLRLFDADGNEIDNSLGVTNTEVLGPVPTAGEYFVQVETFFDAASNYVLNIGRTRTETAGRAADWSSFDDFVPGELYLGPPRPEGERTAAGVPASFPVKRLAGSAARGERTMRIDDGYRSRLRPAAGPRTLAGRHAERLRTLSAIKELHATGRYRYVEPNWLRHSFLTPDDQFFANQWHYRSIKLPQAWDVTTGDPSVVVAVIDSGVLLDHPEFEGQLVPGFDFVSDPARAGDGDGIDPDPDDPGDGEVGGRSSFHGTHVAGTVAARTDNGDPAGGSGGVAGVGWNVRVMPLRALGRGGGTAADVREAMKYAGGLPNVSGTVPAEPADVINLSLGGGGASQADRDVIDRLRAAGVIVIAAAGNDASAQPSFPAAYDGVVSVSATTITDTTASYSNFGPTIDVAAPGGDLATDVDGDGIPDGVLSTIADDADGARVPRLGALSGTSMAAPHVAGVVALMRSLDPDLDPATFDALLASGRITEDLGPAGRDDRFGHGLINAQKAVVAASDGGLAAPFLISSPATLNFGAFTDRLEFRLANAGNAALTVTSIRTDAPWLILPEPRVTGDGLGSYVASVDRDLLPASGIFEAEIEVRTTANTVRIGVVLQRADADLSADAGTTFVILTAPGGGENLVPFEVVEANGGRYEYRFPNVPPGTYELVAGSDSDNDGFLCDGGESCGFFPTRDLPTPLEIDGDRDDADFVTSFQTSISVGPEGTGTDTETAARSVTIPYRRTEPPP